MIYVCMYVLCQVYNNINSFLLRKFFYAYKQVLYCNTVFIIELVEIGRHFHSLLSLL